MGEVRWGWRKKDVHPSIKTGEKVAKSLVYPGKADINGKTALSHSTVDQLCNTCRCPGAGTRQWARHSGDIKIKLVDIELLTIQIRLMIASVEKAKELGMDWCATNRDFNSKLNTAQSADELEA